MKQKKEVKIVETKKAGNTHKPVEKKAEPKSAQPAIKLVAKKTVIIPPEKYFFLSNGVAIKTVFELAETLEHMADDIFRTHVNEHKNDFANWIKDVFGEIALAEQLYHTKDRKATEYILLKFCARKK